MTVQAKPIIKSRYTDQPAKIAEIYLGIEDHGILTTLLTVNYGGGGYQGIGGYSLDAWDAKKKKRVGSAFGMEFIRRTLETIGVNSWDKLLNQPLFVIKEEGFNGKVHGIKGFPEGKPFIFQDLADEFND